MFFFYIWLDVEKSIPTDSGDHDFMSDVMEDPAAVGLLVGLVFIGILIGVASTVAVCLICPSVHR